EGVGQCASMSHEGIAGRGEQLDERAAGGIGIEGDEIGQVRDAVAVGAETGNEQFRLCRLPGTWKPFQADQHYVSLVVDRAVGKVGSCQNGESWIRLVRVSTSCSRPGAAATTHRDWVECCEPSASMTTAPASRAMSAPAAVSHGRLPRVMLISRLPSA